MPPRGGPDAVDVVGFSEYRDGKLQQQWRVGQQGRGDVEAVTQPKQTSGLRQLLLSAFMPVGWPDSVTPDYTGK